MAPGVVTGAHPGAQCRLHHFQRTGKFSVGIHETGFRQFQSEACSDVVATADCGGDGSEHGAGVIAATRRHKVVEQQGQVADPQRGRDFRKGKSLAALFGAYVRGYCEHPGNAEKDLRFLLGWERLVQRRVGEGLRLLAAPGGVQPDRGLRHQRTSQGMPSGSKVEGAPTQVGGGSGIGDAERFGRLVQRRDRNLVTGRGALCQLRGHLLRERSTRKEHRGRLSIERPSHRNGDTGSHRFQGEVVAEHESAVTFGEQIGVHELVNRRQQLRW